MPISAESHSTPAGLPVVTWVAAALAGGASLLRWVGANADTHSWTADGVISLVAGAALMGLAIALVAWPWSARTARPVYLIGAVATAVAVIAFLLPLLQGGPATSGHAGHDMGGGAGVATVDAIRTTMEVALVLVLLWMHRLSSRHTAGVTQEPG